MLVDYEPDAKFYKVEAILRFMNLLFINMCFVADAGRG